MEELSVERAPKYKSHTIDQSISAQRSLGQGSTKITVPILIRPKLLLKARKHSRDLQSGSSRNKAPLSFKTVSDKDCEEANSGTRFG